MRVRQAELAQHDHVAVLQAARGGGDQPVMFGGVAPVQRGQRALDQARHQRDAGRDGGKLRRHGQQRGREGRYQPDPAAGAAQRDRFLDRRLVRFQDGHGGQVIGAGLDARAEGGAGEQDGVGRTRLLVARQGQEAIGHGVVQRALPSKVGREGVVEQVGGPDLGPEQGEGLLDRGDRVFQGVDQGDAHGRVRTGWIAILSHAERDAGTPPAGSVIAAGPAGAAKPGSRAAPAAGCHAFPGTPRAW